MTEDIFKYIDVEQTIAKFGYDPRTLGSASLLPVISLCKEGCGHTSQKNFKDSKIGRTCHHCHYYNVKENRLDESPAFLFVDVEKTIKEFGYDPSGLNKSSGKFIFAKCKDCGGSKKTRCQAITKPTCEQRCKSCAKKAFVVSQVTREKLSASKMGDKNHMKGKTGEKHHLFGVDIFPKTKIKNENWHFDLEEYVDVERTLQELDLNPRILNPKSNKKVFAICVKCKADKGLLRLQTAFKSRHCKFCWERPSGKQHVNFGKPPKNIKGAWYENSEGKRVWMRSKWEVKFALYLDSQSISWEYEQRFFEVSFISEIDNEKKLGTYTPDFRIENGEWFEVKGYWRKLKDAKPKFEAFKAQYPDEKITLLMKPELLALGIEL